MSKYDNPNMTLEQAIAIIKEIEPKDETTNSGTAEKLILQAVHDRDIKIAKIAKWVQANEISDGGTVYCFSKCYECGKKSAINTAFCPNCGAKMDD